VYGRACELPASATATPGTGREILVVQHPADDVLLGWAPDGDKILFASDRTGTIDAWAVPVSEGKARGAPVLMKKDIGPVRPIGFTRDGSYYYGLEAGMKDVYVAALDLTAGTLLSAPTRASRRTVGASSGADWSPSGDSLAYLPQAGPAGHWPDHRGIVIRSLKTGAERLVTPRLRNLDQPRWFSDGRSLLVAGADFRGRPGLYRVGARSGDSTLLVQSRDARESLRSAACSPDGKTVFYLRALATAEPSYLLARNLETGQENELHSAVYRFALSPDGRRLAVITADARGGSSRLMILPAAGGEARTLLSLGLKELIWSDLTWTPDGRALLFTRFKNTPQGRTTVLWRISADGGEPQPLPLEMAGLRNVRVHPDGRQVAFTAGQWATEVWAIDNLLLR
jgi:Tol biopolymer transport system component